MIHALDSIMSTFAQYFTSTWNIKGLHKVWFEASSYEAELPPHYTHLEICKTLIHAFELIMRTFCSLFYQHLNYEG